MLMGLGSLSLYSFFPWSKLVGTALCLMSALQYSYILYFQGGFLDSFMFFSSKPDVFTLSIFTLSGIFFLGWTRKKPTKWNYLYGLFTAIISIGFSFLGILSYAVDFGITYWYPHLFGMINLTVVGISLVSSLRYFILLNNPDLRRWIPLLTGLILMNFIALLSFGLYLTIYNKSFLSNLLVKYAFFGGIVFAIATSYLVHFLLLSQRQLLQIQKDQQLFQKAKEKEELALQESKTGTWQWCIQTNTVVVDEICEQLFGFEKGTFPKTIEKFIDSIYPKDQENVKIALEDSVKTKSPYVTTFRILWPDDSTHFIYIKGQALFNNEKDPLIVTGIAIDVTVEKYAEQLLKLSEQTAKILGKNTSLQEACSDLSTVLHDIFDWNALVIWLKPARANKFLCSAFHIQNKIFHSKKSILSDLDATHPLVQALSKSQTPLIIKDLSLLNYFPSLEIHSAGGIFVPILENNILEAIIGIFKQGPIPSTIDPLFSNSLSLLSVSLEEFIRKEKSQAVMQELAEIINVLQLPVYSLQSDGVIITWNPAAEKILGWQATEVIGKNIKELFPDFAQQEFEMIKQVLKERKGVSWIRCPRNTKKGNLLQVQVSYSPYLDQEGKDRIIVNINDVTQETLAREALHQSEEKFQAFVESSEEWIWEIDQKGLFTYSNPAVKNILGYSPEKILGQVIYIFLPEHQQKEMQRYLQLHIQQKLGWRKRILPWKDVLGKERILESSAWPILSSSQELLGFRGVGLDITDKIELEKIRNEFISIIGHEIKSPLTCIHGALGLLSLEPTTSKKMQELLEIAYHNSLLLVQLVQDIIDIEKIQLGKFVFRLEDLPLYPLVHEAVRTANLLTKNRNITILEKLNTEEISVHVDRERLLQVFDNLLSNAIKFSYDGGEICIFSEIQGDRIRISIQDEGEGVPLEFQSKIFKRFEQAYLFSSKEKKGSGLGLSIVKMLLEQMGGTISFTSIPGRGSTFYFDLPIVHKAEI